MLLIKNWAANLALFIVSCVAAVYLGEFGLEVIGFPRGMNLERVAHPANYSEIRRNIDFTYEFRTNSQGLKSREIPLAKADGERRVFVVGDSYTEGFGLNLPDAYSSRLEAMTAATGRPTVFINGGASGTGPYTYARIFFAVGMLYSPEGLLIGISFNDVMDSPPSMVIDRLVADRASPEDFGASRWSLPRGKALWGAVARRAGFPGEYFPSSVIGEARSRGIPDAQVQEWQRRIPPRIWEGALAGRYNQSILAGGLLNPSYLVNSMEIRTDDARQRLSTMLTILDEMVARSRAKGMQVGVAYIPAPFQYSPAMYAPDNPWIAAGMSVEKDWLTRDVRLQGELAKWSASRVVPYVDMTPGMRAASAKSDDLVFPTDMHWNAKGHQVAADILNEWMRREGLFGQ